MQGARSSAFVQVFVYTGAVMMLFLFVLMMVGVDPSDSWSRHQGPAVWRPAARAAGAADTRRPHAVGPAAKNTAQRDGNVTELANLIFTKYVFLRATSALLITAALGAMVLAHRERYRAKSPSARPPQRFAERAHPAPGPGMFAQHNAADMPALLPDGSRPASVCHVLAPARRAGRPAALRRPADADDRRASPRVAEGSQPDEP